MENNQKIYHTVLLASLLHDIGKFYGRSQEIKRIREELKLEHPEISAYFVKRFANQLKSIGLDPDQVEILTRHHHERSNFPLTCRPEGIEDGFNRVLALLISRADTYSSKERGELGGGGTYWTASLDSIFTQVRIQEGNNDESDVDHYRYSPKPLAESIEKSIESGNIFPQQLNEKMLEYEFHQLVDGFCKKISTIKVNDFNVFYTYLLNVLFDYCWVIPADIREKVRDVSLYDHLRTTSAIAACLYKYHEATSTLTEEEIKDEQKPKFLLIGGDLSGIQNYLYDISNIGAGGVAKRLRARSFILSMILETASFLIIKELDLPISCILYSSGGHFHIIAPNTPQVQKKLKEIREKLEIWILDEYKGNLYLNIEYVPFSCEDLKKGEINSVLRELSFKFSESKKCKFSKVLKTQYNHVLNISFGEELCKVCNKLPISGKDESGVECCGQCLRDKELGKNLVQAKFISLKFFNDFNIKNDDKWAYYLFNKKVGLSVDKEPVKGADLVYCLDHSKIYEFSDFPVVMRYLANYVPYSEGEILTFEKIAEKSEGAKYLGILKADVDRLGLIFSKGLGDRTSISRIATLSRMMDTFFSGYLPIMIKKEYPYTYIVYSGGDDLLLVGPWDKLIELSKRIYDDFKKFTCFNPDITLSAGVALAQRKTPVWQMVRSAGNQLELSKERGRDRLTVFNTSFKWNKYDKLGEIAEILDNGIKNEVISDTFVYSLLQFFPSEPQPDDKKALSKARLTYQIARHLEKEEEETPEKQKLRNMLIRFTTSEGDNLRPHMVFPISCALLKNREKGDE